MEEKIHSISRALITDEEYILTADVGTHLFLPGGHVNYEESLHSSLLRELAEEMGVIDLKVKNFVGIIENVWNNKGKPFHEYSIIFEVHSKKLNRNKDILSKQKHLTFCWHKIEELKHLRFLPLGVYDFVKGYREKQAAVFLSLIK